MVVETHTRPPGVLVTWYDETGKVPVEVGGTQETSAEAFPAEAVTLLGAPASTGAGGVTGATPVP